MSTPTTPTPPRSWPKLLSMADYARACEEVTGIRVSRQAIESRIERGTLQVEQVSIGGKTKKYINTETYPPGAGQVRWPNRPASLQ